MPESVKKAALEGVSLAYRYPDIEKRELGKALGRKLQISPGRIVTGNGAAELIYAIAAAFEPGKAAVLGPTFGEYEKALRIHGWQVMHYLTRREEGYRFTEKALEWLDKEEGLALFFSAIPTILPECWQMEEFWKSWLICATGNSCFLWWMNVFWS